MALMAMGVWLFRADPQKVDVARPEPKRVSRDEFVEIGGIRRPASDLRRGAVPTEDARSADAYYGTTPGIDPKANPQVASVYEALKEHKYPERVSVMIPPKPYDKRAFQADPQRYLNVAEPGRVWQVKQPGPGVPILGGVGELAQSLEQGQPTVLKVNGAPGSPVTFTSLDLGAFENQLTTITVRADSKGIAKTAFTGTSGTMGLVHILAGSPESSGVVRFIVDVEPPRKSAFAGR